MSDAVVCAIAKHEAPYLREWIDYHLARGFSRIYIYDNSDSGNDAACFAGPQVTVYPFPGHRQQMPAYNDMVQRHRITHRWCAFLDIDEFLVLADPGMTVLDLLHRHCPSGALCLNWFLFGSSGHAAQHPGPVTGRFLHRQEEPNPHVKTIAVLADVAHIVDPHSVVLKNGFVAVDTTGSPVPGPVNPRGPVTVAWVNHYFTKSKAEFRDKQLRGRSDTGTVRPDSDFDDHDHNDVHDARAWDFYRTRVLRVSPENPQD
jgi:hypothetical protein